MKIRPQLFGHPLSVTVLGSGGPIADAHRVSAGYLVSIEGKPRILIDAGGGTFERIGQGRLDLSSLEHILLTHTHIDHTSDLAAVIMDLYMCDRKREIAISGPAGRVGNDTAPEYASPQPGAIEFVRLLFGVDGAWRYMNTFDGFGIRVSEMPSVVSDSAVHHVSVGRALEELGVSVSSAAVPHGMMPAVAFRVDYGGESIVFSGDMSGPTSAFIALARDSSILVADFALPERDGPHAHLHTKPSVVGQIARESGTKMLLLSHLMPAIEPRLDEAVAIVRREYSGRVEIAEDLTSFSPAPVAPGR